MSGLVKYIKVFKSLNFVYYYGKMIGLCPFSYSNGILKYSRCGIFYSTGLSLIYLLIFIRRMIERSNFVSPNQTSMYKISEELVVSLQCIVVIVSWFVFAFSQKRLQKIVNDIKSTNRIAKELEILEDPAKFVRIFRFYTLFVNICFFALLTVNTMLYCNTFPNFDVTLSTLFNLPHIVFHNVLVLFVIAMHTMQWRFHRLNFQLRNYPVAKPTTNIFIPRNFEFRSSNMMATSIDNFEKLHSRLKDLTEEIVDFFSLPILMALITGFLQTVSNIYAVYLYDMEYESWKIIEKLLNTNHLIWFLVVVIEMFFLSSVSGSVCEEANNTGSMLHRMRLDYESTPGCENIIRRVSVQLLQKRLNPSLYGFINLNFQFIYSFFGTITTYLIILLQFESTKCKQKCHQ